MRRRRLLVPAFVALTLLGGCTTVPQDSPPHVVKPVQPGGARQATPDPVQQDASPRAVVNYFLAGNANVNDPQNSAARSVLTADSGWVPSGVTVVDRVQVGNPLGRGDTLKVTVSGNQLGTLDKDGRYSPTLSGTGSTPYSRQFTLVKMRTAKSRTKQWRIAEAPKGVLLSVDQFEESYRQRVLYFFDQNYPQPTTQFVPEARYTDISDPALLTTWLVQGLAGDTADLTSQQGPLQVANNSPVVATYPAADSPLDVPVKIDVPGARRLGAESRNALAAEFAATLGQVPSIRLIQITDNGQPLRISAVSDTTFSPDSASLVDRYRPAQPDEATLYYVNQGSAYRDSGTRLALPNIAAAVGGYSLRSIALHPTESGALFDVAATYGSSSKDDARFAIGTQGRLKVVAKIRGQLSRPSWQPDGQYAWIGAGKDLYRVSPTGTASLFKLNLPGGQRLSAVRVSPDGGRIALVVSSIASTGKTSQVYVATITPGDAGGVSSPEAITPSGLLITDVAWYDQLKLFAVGTVAGSTSNFVFYEVQCDGSALTKRSTENLPDPPDSLTITDGALAVVSVGSTLWRLTDQGDKWNQIHADALLPGNPVYVE